MATILKKTTKSTAKPTNKAKKVKTEKLTPFQKKVKKGIQQGYREMLLIEKGEMEGIDAWNLLKEL
jgi:hypothetical protein